MDMSYIFEQKAIEDQVYKILADVSDEVFKQTFIGIMAKRQARKIAKKIDDELIQKLAEDK